MIEQAAGDVIFEKTSVADQLIPQPEFAFNGETYVFDNRLYFRYLKKRKTVIRKIRKSLGERTAASGNHAPDF